MKKGRYLITGCAGFIGSNLVKKIYKNYDLILVDDLSRGSVLNLPQELKKNPRYKKTKNKKIKWHFSSSSTIFGSIISCQFL